MSIENSSDYKFDQQEVQDSLSSNTQDLTSKLDMQADEIADYLKNEGQELPTSSEIARNQVEQAMPPDTLSEINNLPTTPEGRFNLALSNMSESLPNNPQITEKVFEDINSPTWPGFKPRNPITPDYFSGELTKNYLIPKATS